jgi:6-phosphogluconolactonase (cycloisomerase 2 family)
MLCPTDVAVSPDGKSVYVTGSDSGAVAVFSRNLTSGALSFVESETGGTPRVPYGLAISPDGKHVYVSDYDGGVLAYARNATNGALSFVDKHVGQALAGAQYLGVSPNGKSVYVPASGGRALNVFSRNATTGALTAVEVKKQGVGGVDGLNGASAVAVSEDGDDVYVTAVYQGTVATFARSSSTGRLQFRGLKKTGAGACDLAVAPDDVNVYVAGCDSQAMAIFSRNRTTGALTTVGIVKHGDRGVDLREFWGPSVSPDGKNVYVADLTGDAVGTFVRNPPPFHVTLDAKDKQPVDELKFNAECSLACGLFATAHVKVGHSKYSSQKVKADLSGLDPTTLQVKFSSSTLSAIRKQLKRHSGEATIRANGAAGEEQDTKEVVVSLRR